MIPPGFVLMPGNDSLRPFLIGENPVSNFEYLLYQKWLNATFSDYPEVYENSLIKDYESDVKNPFNDPVQSSYLGHPAFANYPVLGASWIQAMEYCSWKNDRMNEAIFKAIEDLDSDPNASDFSSENNFNTEAFLNGQFVFRDGWKEKYSSQYDNQWQFAQNPNSASLFPFFIWGCRIPTEDEWEFYHASGQGATARFREYSVLKYADYFRISDEMVHEYERNPYINVANGLFYEWTLDVYSEAPTSYSNPESIFEKNGFYLTRMENGFLDAYGSIVEKDSLGKLGYRIMGWNPGGDAITINNYGRWVYKYTQHSVEPDSAFLTEVTRIYKSNHIDSLRRISVGKSHLSFSGSDFELSIYGFKVKLQTRTYTTQFPAPNGAYVYRNGVGYQMPMYIDSIKAENDIEYLRRKAVFTFITTDSCYGCYPVGNEDRTIRSSSGRSKQKESKGITNTGFRIVFPYYGNALPKPISW